MAGKEARRQPILRCLSRRRFAFVAMALVFSLYLLWGNARREKSGETRVNEAEKNREETSKEPRTSANEETTSILEEQSSTSEEPSFTSKEPSSSSESFTSKQETSSTLGTVEAEPGLGENFQVTPTDLPSPPETNAFEENMLLGDLPLRYIHDPRRCEDDVFLLLEVLTRPESSAWRKDIRESWGKPDSLPDVRLVFLLGRPNASVANQSDLDEEAREHGDIVQADFFDSYRNLTYKTLLGLSWASRRCSRAAFVGKVDDDTFLDIFRIYDYLKTVNCSQSCVIGRIILNAPVIRQKTSKWFVSEAEYASERFPDYMAGWTYFVTMDFAARAAEIASGTEPLPIEDVYVTGMLADSLNATRMPLPPTRYEGGEDVLGRFAGPCRGGTDPWIVIVRNRSLLVPAYRWTAAHRGDDERCASQRGEASRLVLLLCAAFAFALCGCFLALLL